MRLPRWFSSPLVGVCLLALAHAQSPSPQPSRFAVAHAHALDWCLGYLYVGSDAVSFEVVQPRGWAGHSFHVSRSELTTVRPWTYLGRPKHGIELKFGKSVYHFWWLPQEQQVEMGRPYRFEPPDALDPEPLVAAIQDPAANLARALALQNPAAANPAAASGVAPAPTSASGAAPDNSSSAAPTLDLRGVAGLYPITREAWSGSGTNRFPLDMQPLPPAQRLDGLYLDYVDQPNLSSVSPHFYVLYPEGWFMAYDGQKSLIGFDFMKAARAGILGPNDYGRYFPEDAGTVHMIYQSGMDFRINISDTRPVNWEKYIKLCRCDGLKLAGGFRAAGYAGTLSFTSDGRFSDRGAIHDLMQYAFFREAKATGNLNFGEEITRPGVGTYAIAQNTIVLYYSDGRRIGATFAAPADLSRPPDSILINGTPLTRISGH
jgi:hypothetical protein